MTGAELVVRSQDNWFRLNEPGPIRSESHRKRSRRAAQRTLVLGAEFDATGPDSVRRGDRFGVRDQIR